MLAGVIAITAAPAASPAAAMTGDDLLGPTGVVLLPELTASRMAGDVALSGDGTVAVAGGEAATDRAPSVAAVFVRDGRTWVRQAQFGPPASSSALSADGSAIAIGTIFGADARSGGVTFYGRAGGAWTRIGPELVTPYDGGGAQASWFGASVALSADGSAAVVGAPQHNNAGTAWGYARSGDGWVSTGMLGSGAEPFFTQRGRDVALSADGTVALVGSSTQTETYRRAGTGWEPGPTIPAAGTVSLSADAAVALVGARAFLASGEGWVPGPAASPAERVGPSTLSADGAVALVTLSTDLPDPDLVQAFARDGAAWKPLARPVGVLARFGGLALDGDGDVGLLGSDQRTQVIARTVSVRAVSPTVVSTSGGETVTVEGEGFTDVQAVRFDGRPAGRVAVRSPRRLDVVTPALRPGATDVTVDSALATSPAQRLRVRTPTVRLTRGALRIALARPRVRLTCGPVACRGTLRLLAPSGVLLARATFKRAAGATKTVALRVTAAARARSVRRLARARLIVAVDGGARTARRVRLR